MWDRRKLFLAAIIFSAVCYRVSITSLTNSHYGSDVRNINCFLLKLYSKLHTQFKVTAKLLDKAPDAVDDRYNECHKEALKKFIDSGLLRQELNHSESFKNAWNKYTQCSMPIPGGEKEHAVALATYANEEHVINSFNNTVGTMIVNASTYENSFPFKSLYFLLMDALTLLNSMDCKTLYFVTEKEYNAQPGSHVRFGTFSVVYPSLSSLDSDVASMTVFNITTCFFAELGGNKCVKDKEEALLSPAEEFTVEGVHRKKYDGDEYTEIVLKHLKVHSFQNCEIFSR